MDQNEIYSRQQLLDLEVPERAVVVGCGGVGSWVALLLAMSGTKELVLFDDDVVEESNLARCLFVPDEVGQPKVDATTRLIERFRPSPTCVIVPRIRKVRVRDLQEAHREGVPVFDCTDSVEAQAFIYRHCPSRIRVGYDGPRVTVLEGQVPEWGEAWEDDPYRIVPTWALGAALAGVLGVGYVHRRGKAGHVDVNLDDLVGRDEDGTEVGVGVSMRTDMREGW